MPPPNTPDSLLHDLSDVLDGGMEAWKADGLPTN